MQAARGEAIAAHHEPTQPRPARTGLLLALVAVVGYAIDQGTKQGALERLADGDVPLVGDILVLHLTTNPGAAFSTGTGHTWIFTVLAAVAAVVVVGLALRVRSRWWAVALGFLLAGVAGNLTDRLVREPAFGRGHVIDFLMLPNWPVFNVADVCINVAAGMILVAAFRGLRMDGSRVRDDVEHPGEQA
ncbi:signal peptidase II [Nocardioides acrostichi]|uniref:Lipoprotein signal peptidase n=1 Tax=Nocardioides acrostichi TaxID=2784339 RepID=A0A930UYB0_9ACTN|nr:signal peptidase II [Nocardioides acrostichi]MBF4160634.1 signal peptidase II [Nocardioides acrostichi]